MDHGAIVIVDDANNELQLPGISFMALREGRCKFPLGNRDEPATRFCGETAAVGSVYCSKCRRIVYAQKARKSGTRAERRLGEMLREQPKNESGRPSKTPSKSEGVSDRTTLQEAGIDYKLSSRAQKLAAIKQTQAHASQETVQT